MAHQCLQCGASFPDGSAELLRGCACGGTRFYYTQAPLAKAERDALMAQANQDLKGILQELVKTGNKPAYEDPVWSPEARRQWLQVDAKKLRAHQEGAVQQARPPVPEPPAARAARPRAEQATLPLQAPEPSSSTPSLDDSQPREAKPEVVVVAEPGTYEIDVEQLLDKSPIVVRRDGVYVVHLPSAFAQTGARR